MPTETSWNNQEKRLNTRKITTKDEVEDAQTAARLQDTSGLAAAAAARAKKGKGAMPKQEPGEDAASYGKRLRAWRETPDDAPPKNEMKAPPMKRMTTDDAGEALARPRKDR